MSFGLLLSPTQASVPCGYVLSVFNWQQTISLQVQRFRASLMEWRAQTVGVNPVDNKSILRFLIYTHGFFFFFSVFVDTHFMAGRVCWCSHADMKRWRLDVSQVTYTEAKRRLWCPLLFHGSLWSERLRWFKRAQDIWQDWYGSPGMWLITCLCSEGVCVCFTVRGCFPICFLCVFDKDERGLCSHAC